VSEHHVTIVDIDVSLAEAPAQAARIVAWLQSKGIVAEGVRVGTLWQRWLDSIGSNGSVEQTQDDTIVYPPGPRFRDACTGDDPSTLFYNWLDVKIGRTVFTAGEYGIGVHCPSCKAEQSALGSHWGDAIAQWFEEKEDRFACAACGHEAPLRQWDFDPLWAFGNLGFQFSDWGSLKPEFIRDFTTQLGNEARVVHMWL
jgi:Zn ribbon nucleic-acid-binding protein